jgi:hypothetical protein
MLETAIANDSNPGVAISLLGLLFRVRNDQILHVTDYILGLTVQQAQALGLHLKQNDISPSTSLTGGVHPLWRAIMFLDSNLSTAFDRRPLSFLPSGCSLICNSTIPASCLFSDNMHALYALKVDW